MVKYEVIVEFRNAFGELQAAQIAKLPFYGGIAILYAVVGAYVNQTLTLVAQITNSGIVFGLSYTFNIGMTSVCCTRHLYCKLRLTLTSGCTKLYHCNYHTPGCGDADDLGVLRYVAK